MSRFARLIPTTPGFSGRAAPAWDACRQWDHESDVVTQSHVGWPNPAAYLADLAPSFTKLADFVPEGSDAAESVAAEFLGSAASWAASEHDCGNSWHK